MKLESAPTVAARFREGSEGLIVESSRLASAEDLGVLTALGERARIEMRPKRGGAVLSRLDPYASAVEDRMSKALADPSLVVALGTFNGVAVAYGLMTISEVADGSTHAVIEELFVEPDGRGVGVGESLADLLLRVAAERGALGVDALALPGDRATKNFFESRGMVARAILVHRGLTDR